MPDIRKKNNEHLFPRFETFRENIEGNYWFPTYTRSNDVLHFSTGDVTVAATLSDNLKPWEVIETRLHAAAAAGFVIALYNPISRARPWQLGRALERLRTVLPETTPVIFGRAAGRPDERMAICSLSDARPEMADMATCIIVGSSETRLVRRSGKPPLVYTPRSYTGPSR